jgi:hypothetical protein
MPSTSSRNSSVEGAGATPTLVDHGEPSIRDLVGDLTHEAAELVRKEVELARVEIEDKIDRLQSGFVSMTIGGSVAFAGLLFVLASAALGLDRLLHERWLSSLIVGAGAALVGVSLLAWGRRSLGGLAPKRSLRSLNRDKEMIQEHLPAGGA